MNRYAVLPVTLYRTQRSKIRPKLLQKSKQALKDQYDYDFVLGANGLYNPCDDSKFTRSNGLLFRPMGTILTQFFQLQRKNKVIIELPQGLQLPKHFVMIHEVQLDIYSLQTRIAIKPKKFQSLAQKFFETQKILTRDELSQKIGQYFDKIITP